MIINLYKGGVLGEPRFPKKNVKIEKSDVKKKLK
jgi:hypothetical protein